MKPLFTLLIGMLMSIPSFASDVNQIDEPRFKSLDDVVFEVAERALNGIYATNDFILDKSPLIIQQFLRWKLFEHGMKIIFSILTLITLYLIFRTITVKYVPDDYDGSKYNHHFLGRMWDGIDTDCNYPSFSDLMVVLMIINLFVILIVFFNHILPIVQIIVAPYVYLIETVLNKI